MKNGFDAPGGAASLEGGSFGERVARSGLGRPHRALRRLRRRASAGRRRLAAPPPTASASSTPTSRPAATALTADLSYTGADNALDGEGAAPVQELAVSRALVFTSPQANADRLSFVTLNLGYAATPDAVAAGRRLCAATSARPSPTAIPPTRPPARGPALAGLLCQSDGTTPLSTSTAGRSPISPHGGTSRSARTTARRIHTAGLGGARAGDRQRAAVRPRQPA